MTLIVGLDCSEYLLLGADGAVTTDKEIVLPYAKLDFRQSPPIAWGFSGNEDAGIAFGQWMSSIEIPSATTWKTLRDWIETKVDEINAERKRRVFACGRNEILWNDTLSVLVACVIGGQRKLLLKDAESTASEVPNPMDRPVIAVGLDGYADEAYQALVRLKAWDRNVEWFGVLLNLAVSLGDRKNLRGPCRVLRISGTGVTDVSDDVFRATFPQRKM